MPISLLVVEVEGIGDRIGNFNLIGNGLFAIEVQGISAYFLFDGAMYPLVCTGAVEELVRFFGFSPYYLQAVFCIRRISAGSTGNDALLRRTQHARYVWRWLLVAGIFATLRIGEAGAALVGSYIFVGTACGKQAGSCDECNNFHAAVD